MIVRVLFTAALFIRLASPVAAVPPFFQRDVSCVATRTVTVTATVTGGSPPASDLSVSSPIPQTAAAAAVSTNGAASSPANVGNGGSGATASDANNNGPGATASNVNNGGSGPTVSNVNTGSGATAAGPGVQTVTIVSTVTVISTVQPTAGPNGGQQVTGPNSAPKTSVPADNGVQPSDPNSGNSGPVTVTVTVTSNLVVVSTVIQTQTVYQNQTITQTQTVVQTVTQTAAAAVNNGGSGAPNGDQSGAAATETVFSTLTSLLVISRPASQLPGPSGSPLQPSVQPHYSNGTQPGQFLNSSNSSFPAPSSLRSPIPFLPSVASTAAPQASSPPVASYSNSSSSSPNATHSSGGYENSLYFANWAIYGAKYQPQSLPASSVTRINYAFADIDSNGFVVSSDPWADTGNHYSTDSWSESGNNAYGCVKQLYLLKKSNRALKVILAIGGWTWSSKFSPVAADPTMRQNFASSAVKLVTDWGFDGVDIDWEFNAYAATSDDTKNFVLLLQAVRNAFSAWSAANAPGYNFVITVASPAGPAVYGLLDLAGMDPYVDSWNLMAYDYAGSWSTAAGHQANIYFDAQNEAATPYSTDQAVTAYVAAGVAPGKIVMGLPLYGRSFEGTAGLGQAYDGVGPGDPTLGPGQWRLSGLPRAGAVELFDGDAQASYSYDAATRELISYDNLRSATAKSAYLVGKGLGGAMFWEASDDRTGPESLVVAMAGQLGALAAAQNLLSYPTSQYDNIRNGVPGS